MATGTLLCELRTARSEDRSTASAGISDYLAWRRLVSVTNPVSMVGAQPISYARKKGISVSFPEAAVLIYFTYITAAGFVLHLAATEVFVITVLNALTFAAHVAETGLLFFPQKQ